MLQAAMSKRAEVYSVSVCMYWYRLKGKENQVKTMEALLEEKEKEIVKKGEWLKVNFLGIFGK